jgi:hypothetical protein
MVGPIDLHPGSRPQAPGFRLPVSGIEVFLRQPAGAEDILLTEAATLDTGLALALAGARPNPTTSGALAVRFTLRDASPATLELFDVGGRRAYGCSVGALGAGEHTLSLAGARLRPGLYFARLRQQGESRRGRILIVP